MTIEQLASDIRAVVAYNWQDEARDFEEQDDGGREHHIFRVLQRLDEFVETQSPI